MCIKAYNYETYSKRTAFFCRSNEFMIVVISIVSFNSALRRGTNINC